MQWLPTSHEGKQLFGLGVGSVVAILVLVAGVFSFLVYGAVQGQAERDLEARAEVIAALLRPDEARLAQLEQEGRVLQAWILARDGTVKDSTMSTMKGQRGDDARSILRGIWPDAIVTHTAIGGGDTLYVAALKPEISRVVPTAIIGLGASLLLGFLALPFFVRLGANWVTPLNRILEADRPTREDRNGVQLQPQTYPSGVLRELVARRNQRLEALRAKEDALSRRSADMEVLYELSRQLGLSREAPDIPDLALEHLAKVVDYDVACVLVFSDDQRSLTLRSRGPAQEVVKAEVEGMAVNAFFEKTGILLDNESLQVGQHVNDVRAARIEGKVKAWYWTTIAVSNKTVGVMGVLSTTDKTPLSPEGSRLVGIVAQNTSLALEKLAFQRIEETQRFRNVLENLAEGVVLVRQNGEWALATGTSREFHQVICGSEAQGTPEHSRECPIGLLGLDVFHGGKAISRELTRNDRTFILGGTFVRSITAGEQGAVISIRDVTDERATQQKLFQASKLASLGELAAGVAHEVNNPLTGILGFTELLLARPDLTQPVIESLQEIHGLARRTNQITMDLLLFARVQREGGFRAVSLRAVVKDTMKLLETSYRNLHLELVADLGPDDDRLLALGDQGKIQQIVMNLAQNAKDAITMAGKGHRIVFRGRRQKGEIVFEVEDDGPGIPDRVRSKVFEPFFTTKPIGKGTGLGLAIVNRIVEEHKGRLTIDTEEGRGTIFRIVLPEAPAGAEEAPPHVLPVPAAVARPDGDQPAAKAGPAASNGIPKATVVVLDDEETVLKFLTRTLQSDGVQVHTTSDPDEAVRLIELHRPDLLFLDFRMPLITGEEFYGRMVDIDPKWAERIIFLTGDASGDEIQGFLKKTGAPALTKPIGIRDLRSFVDKKLSDLHAAAEAV
jgi:signal transduction histidine kinase/ActR/RegA family two-component response regulator